MKKTSSSSSYNMRNPSVRRIMKEFNDMSKNPSPQYAASPLEDNIFEWHFTIRGTPGTDFEGGIYHGRIILPTEYPFKPPNIVLLTPTGRFEVGVKICLSISAHHPEFWQPSWSIRTVLLALISFMPSKGEGALGALDWTTKERKALAKSSVDWTCAQCGSCNRTALPDPSTCVPVSSASASSEGSGGAAKGKHQEALSIVFKLEGESKPARASTTDGGGDVRVEEGPSHPTRHDDGNDGSDGDGDGGGDGVEDPSSSHTSSQSLSSKTTPITSSTTSPTTSSSTSSSITSSSTTTSSSTSITSSSTTTSSSTSITSSSTTTSSSTPTHLPTPSVGPLPPPPPSLPRHMPTAAPPWVDRLIVVIAIMLSLMVFKRYTG